jgi:hypothetical protein
VTGISRYAGCPTAVLTATGPAAGTDVGTAYLLPRVPSQVPAVPQGRHLVLPGDRLDLIAFRHLGDPGAAWRICDANAALDPEDLVGPGAVGTALIIPSPQPGG